MDDIEMLKSWHVRLRSVEKAHFRACVRNRTKHFVLGGFLITISSLSVALTGEDISKALADSPKTKYAIELGILVSGILAPVLAAVVTFFGFQSRSIEHHHAAAKYAALKRMVAIAISKREHLEADDQALGYETLKQACTSWDSMTAECPPLYKKDWPEVIEYEAEMGISPNRSTAML